MRDGYYARWMGEEFPCGPAHEEIRLYSADPRMGFVAAAPGRFVKVVPETEVEGLYYVVTRCRWRDEPQKKCSACQMLAGDGSCGVTSVVLLTPNGNTG